MGCKMKMARRLFRYVPLFLAISFAGKAAQGQNVCQVEAGRADTAIREQYQQSIDYFLRLAAAARIKGLDPRNFPQADPSGGVEAIDLIQIVTNLSSQRDQGIQAIYSGYQACVAQTAPYQVIVNTAVFYLSGGMSQVVPRKAMFIDATNLLAGTPFGGPNALVPQMREHIFSTLGIGGATADFIRNPLQLTQNGPLRLPWNPIFGGVPGVPLPKIPPLPPLLGGAMPGLPAIPSPKPIEVGKVGGHRVCLPWC